MGRTRVHCGRTCLTLVLAATLSVAHAANVMKLLSIQPLAFEATSHEFNILAHLDSIEVDADCRISQSQGTVERLEIDGKAVALRSPGFAGDGVETVRYGHLSFLYDGLRFTALLMTASQLRALDSETAPAPAPAPPTVPDAPVVPPATPVAPAPEAPVSETTPPGPGTAPEPLVLPVAVIDKDAGETDSRFLVLREGDSLIARGTQTLIMGGFSAAGFTGTLSANNFGDGGEHGFVVDLEDWQGLAITTDPAFPLTLQVTPEGYAYLCGRGTVTPKGGPRTVLGTRISEADWLAGLGSPSALVRQGSCEAVMRLGIEGAVPALVGLLRDEVWKVRRDAAEALGLAGDTTAADALAALLGDAESGASEAAADALATLGSGLSDGVTGQVVERLKAATEDTDRDRCARALRAGGNRARELLRAALGATQDPARRKALQDVMDELAKPLPESKGFVCRTPLPGMSARPIVEGPGVEVAAAPTPAPQDTPPAATAPEPVAETPAPGAVTAPPEATPPAPQSPAPAEPGGAAPPPAPVSDTGAPGSIRGGAEPAPGTPTTPPATTVRGTEAPVPEAPADTGPVVHARKEWSDLSWDGADDATLPRVLILSGDGVSMGYEPVVTRLLAGRYHVDRLSTSRSLNDPVLAIETAMMLREHKYAAVLFNSGLNGLHMSGPQYGAGLARYLALIRKQCGQARLIWLSSTPLTQAGDVNRLAWYDYLVTGRNALAATMMAEAQVPVIDLYGAVSGKPQLRDPDGYHYNAAGYEVLGQAVADAVLSALQPR